jgi:hypothetical protein
LLRDKLVVFRWVRREFGQRKGSIVKVGSEARGKDVHQFWVSLNPFGLLADDVDAGGLPFATGDGLTLEDVVVAFDVAVTGRAAWVVASGSGVECLAGRKEAEAEFEIENAEPVASSIRLGEGFPVDSFDGVIAPSEAVVKIGFEESQAVLTSNSGRQVPSHRPAAEGQLNFGRRKQRNSFARRWVLKELASGEDVSIAVELCRKGKFVVGNSVILVALDMVYLGEIGESSKEGVNGGQHVVLGVECRRGGCKAEGAQFIDLYYGRP